jgi:hypothetical protein
MPSETRRLLVEHLPPPIAAMVHGYFTARNNSAWPGNVGYLGDWEGCFDLGEENLNDCLEGACAGGHVELAAELIRAGAWHLNRALWFACQDDDPTVAELLIAHGARNFEHGMVSACEHGAEAMVKIMRDHGACDYEAGLRAACYGGSCALAEQMIGMGATGFGVGLQEACTNGQHETAAYMISLGVGEHLKTGMVVAAERGYLDLVKMIEIAGGDAFLEVFFAGCRNGHLDIVKYAASKGISAFSDAANMAADADHLDIIKYAYEQDPDIRLDHVAFIAAYANSIDTMIWLRDSGYKDTCLALLKGACASGSIDFVGMTIKSEVIGAPECDVLFAWTCDGLNRREEEEKTPELMTRYRNLMGTLIRHGAGPVCQRCNRSMAEHVAA